MITKNNLCSETTEKNFRKHVRIVFMAIMGILLMVLTACADKGASKVEIKDGYWVIDGEETGVKAEGEKGEDGTDGITPEIDINQDGYWVINGIVTEVKAEGQSGTVSGIEINQEGYWVINGVTTEVKAKGENGEDGTDGITPEIEINQEGYWVINGVTTEVKAKGENGEDGTDGITPEIEINQEGYWVINGVTTEIKAIGENGINGKDIFELYKEIYGYDGTEKEWLDEILNKSLAGRAYTVSLDYNGMQVDDGTLTAITAYENRYITLPLPEREGYIFEGWYTGNGINDGQWLNTMKVSSDMNLIAKWRKESFTVRFETESGELLKEEVVEYGENANPPVAPHIENYVFEGWSEEITGIKDDVIIYPVYVAVRYTITYNTDGGSEIPAETYLYNQKPDAPIVPEKSGFVFIEWRISGSDVVFNFDAPLASDIELIAVWSDTVGISDAEGLLEIGSNPSGKYSLLNNINLKGAEWNPISSFSGTLDGQGYKIYNFTISGAGSSMGFFIRNQGTIKNIVFSDIIISNTCSETLSSSVGAVAATNEGTISNVTLRETALSRTCSAQKSGTFDYCVGGIAGNNSGSKSEISDITIETLTVSFNLNYKSKAYCDYSAYIQFGNIAGKNSGLIKNITVSAALNYRTSSMVGLRNHFSDYCGYVYSNIGGITGENTSVVDKAKANIDMDLSTTASNYDYESFSSYQYLRAGGIAGYNEGEVNNSYSEGNLTSYFCGDSKVKVYGGGIGGIVGVNEKSNVGIVDGCKSILNMDISAYAGEGAGGIVGTNEKDAKIMNCLFAGSIKGKLSYKRQIGGIAGATNGGTITYCVFEGSIEEGYSSAGLGGFVGKLGEGTTLSRSINDGQIVVTNSQGTPEYISSSLIGATVLKCYRTENAVLTAGETVTDGTQSETALLVPKTEIISEEYLYEQLIFDENIWGIDNGEVYLIALETSLN